MVLTFFWYMLVIYVFFMVIWFFIKVFGEIFHRDDMSGLAKAGWILLICVVPLVGLLVYVVAAPKYGYK
jgi:hypothetical protein